MKNERGGFCCRRRRRGRSPWSSDGSGGGLARGGDIRRERESTNARAPRRERERGNGGDMEELSASARLPARHN